MSAKPKIISLLVIIMLGLLLGNGCKPAIKDEKRVGGYLDSFPRHSQVFSQAPLYVAIRFKGKIGKDSRIIVRRGGDETVYGPTTMAADGLSMSASLDQGGDGDYTVEYVVSDRQGKMSKGRFAFVVASVKAKTYEDRSGITDVLIEVTKTGLNPRDIVITKGARVTWVNCDNNPHKIVGGLFAISDSGLSFSSPLLKKGEIFTYAINDIGEWTYRQLTGSNEDTVANVLVKKGNLGTEMKEPEQSTKSVPKQAEPLAGQIENIEVSGFKGSSPTHGASLKSVPLEVRIEFTERIGTRSNIRVSKAMADMNLGPTEISDDRRTMSVRISPAGGKGTYLVKYRVYLSDSDIENGQFAFEIR